MNTSEHISKKNLKQRLTSRKSLIAIVLITSVLAGAYAIATYTWRVDYSINRLTSFEKLLIPTTTGATWADTIPAVENETTGQLIGPTRIPHRMIVPLVPGVNTTNLAEITDPRDPRLGTPAELFTFASQINGTVVVVPLTQATPFERSIVQTQGGAIVAILNSTGSIINPQYHEAIHVPQRLALNFAVSSSDTSTLAKNFLFLKVCFDIYGPGPDGKLGDSDDVEVSQICMVLVDGGFVLLPFPAAGGVGQGSVVKSTILPPGDYGVIKKAWYFTQPVTGTVSGVFTVMVWARVVS